MGVQLYQETAGTCGCPNPERPLACGLHEPVARVVAGVPSVGQRVGHIGRRGRADLDRAALVPDRGVPDSLGQHGEHAAGGRLSVREQGDLRRRAGDSRHRPPAAARSGLLRAGAGRDRRIPLGRRLDAQSEHREAGDRRRRGHPADGARHGVSQRKATGRALRAAPRRWERARPRLPAAADAGVAAAILYRARYRALPPHHTRLGPGRRDARAFFHDGRQPRRVLRQPLLGIPAAGAHRGKAAHHLSEHRDQPAPDPLEPDVPPTPVKAALLAALCAAWSPAAAQQPDTTARPPQPTDSLKVYTLPPAVVSVTRANPPINRIPQAVQLVEKAAISRARPTWGLDEALVSVPGVYAANRYNFSLDQRISIRGVGARSAFAVRGVKVIVDGIPQTLPDGQSQLTNLELGAADRIEILRGSSSALFGNASGGVISIWTDPTPPQRVRQDVRVLFGSFDRDLARNWSKWQSSTALRVGPGSALVTVSRLDYTGERDHSAADFRDLNTRWHFPLAPGWSLAATADVGWDPRADNPGGLNPVELASNPDAAAPLNLSRNAGKDVTQGQAGVTLQRSLPDGGEAFLTVFGFTRGLTNPTTQAYIHLDRVDYGARAGMTRPLPIGTLEHRLTAGIDFQRQRDDRLNYGYFTAAPSQPDTTARLLDQLEHVTEVGPYVQSALQITPHLAVTAGLRHDGPGVLPQRRAGAAPRHRARHRSAGRRRRGPDHGVDVLRFSLRRLRGRHARAGRPGAARDPPALAAPVPQGPAGVRARRLGRARGEALVWVRRGRHHVHEPRAAYIALVDHECAARVERSRRGGTL